LRRRDYGAGRLKAIAEELFERARFAGELGEGKKERLGKPACENREDHNCLFGAGALENHEIQILDSARQFRLATQGVVQLLEFFVNGAGSFEIEIFAGFVAFGFVGGAEGSAAGFEELDEAADFDVVFFFAATAKAWREAHFHFGVDAAGKGGIAANFDLATADFEEVEDTFGESVGGFSGGEGAVVRATGGCACCIHWDPACGVTAGIGVAQIHFKDCGRAKAHHGAIFFGEELLCVLVVGERLFERGSCYSIADCCGKIAQVEAFAGGIERAEESLQAAAQILRLYQIRLGPVVVRLD